MRFTLVRAQRDGQAVRTVRGIALGRPQWRPIATAACLCKGGGVTTEDSLTDIRQWPITRRQLLAAGAATGFGALAAACGQSASPSASTVARSAAVPPAGSDIGAVEHVIFLMMENRSFDHYYGTYPGVRGFDDHPAGDLGPFSQPWQAPGDDLGLEADSCPSTSTLFTPTSPTARST